MSKKIKSSSVVAATATGTIITAAAPVAVLGAVAYWVFKFFED